MKMVRTFLGALLLGALVACGGGGSATPEAKANGALGDLTKATVSDETLDGRATRKQALSATGDITPGELFAWAQALLPGAFPAEGAVTGTVDYLGTTYVFQAYATGYYLGVTYSGGVYMLSPDGRLEQFGVLADYVCQVKPTACGAPVTIAGKITIKVTTHTVTANLVGGKLAAVSTGTADPAQIAKVCAESLVLGFGGHTKACAPFVNGQGVILGVTNNDRVQYSFRTWDDQPVWLGLDPSQTSYWQCEGLGCRYAGPEHPGFVEYSEGGVGYRKPRISVAAGQLILSFGRNHLAGFGLEGAPTQFVGEHFEFVFRSTTNLPTKAYRTWNEATKEYQVVFQGTTLQCVDTGNITVHRQVLGTPGQVHFSDVPAGWLSVATPPNPADLIWGFGPGVTPVVQPPLVGFTYRLTGC